MMTPGLARREGGILLPLKSFTANLVQGDGPMRFVRLNAVLKFSESSNQDEFKSRKSQIRDAIIGILNSKRAEDLLEIRRQKLFETGNQGLHKFIFGGWVGH